MHRSDQLFTKAQKILVGGVNSPVRAFNGVGGSPIFFKSAKGAWLVDVDDRNLIDYVGSWGPMILGHNHPDVVEAVRSQALQGLSFGAPSELETELASLVREIVPSMERLRMVNSGTEATMSAIRLARGYTGRDYIVKFEGGYHGHSDSLLVKAGSGALTLGIPSSPGVPVAVAQHTITLTFNDLNSVEAMFSKMGSKIAGIIVEPVAGNMNCIPPKSGFLDGLRHVCDQYGSVLIFDEVMTGFRVALGGAQEYYNVKPDITTLGKIIGGGLPVGAFGGRLDIMEHLAPLGPVYQAGTLSGNPLAMAAGIATLKNVMVPSFYKSLTEKATTLLTGLQTQADKAEIPFHTSQVGGMYGLYFTDQKQVESFAQVMKCNTDFYSSFFHGMLNEGVYFAPSAFEAGFISSVHGKREVDATIAAAEKVFSSMPG